jgi:hypothetical protein
MSLLCRLTRSMIPIPASGRRTATLLLAFGMFALFAIDCSAWQSEQPLPDAQTGVQTGALTDAQIIQRIDDAVHVRTQSVASYTVQELYSIYRNGETTPSIQVTVKTVYTRSTGKDYTPIAQTGSSILRTVVVDRVLANEKEMAKAANRESVALISANYEMHPHPGKVQMNGHECIIVDLKAKRKISYLFNGKAWFDAADFTLVHIEGSPAASPSFFAGETSGIRDYTKVEGFSMAQHGELRSHSFLFGNTVMKIDYTDYQIQLEPNAPNPTNP